MEKACWIREDSVEGPEFARRGKRCGTSQICAYFSLVYQMI